MPRDSKPDLAMKYDESFFEIMDQDAQRSARIVLELLQAVFHVKSVADFGCGSGVWLRAWQELGCNDVVGVDGDFVERSSLQIDPAKFIAHDLQQPLDLKRRFSLVQSLEVAEHLPAASAQQFIDMLTTHGDLILFSAAVPGQMGIQHINEQPYEYWRELFARRGYAMFDWLRPLLPQQQDVAYWYRYNTFLFVRESTMQQLPPAVRQTRLPIDQAVPDISPFAYRCRLALTRWLPVSAVDAIVQWLHRREQSP